MTIRLDIDFDEFEEWLTPEVIENAFRSAGYEAELKDEYKYRRVFLKERSTDIHLNSKSFQPKEVFTVISSFTKQRKSIKGTNLRINGAA